MAVASLPWRTAAARSGQRPSRSRAHGSACACSNSLTTAGSAFSRRLVQHRVAGGVAGKCGAALEQRVHRARRAVARGEEERRRAVGGIAQVDVDVGTAEQDLEQLTAHAAAHRRRVADRSVAFTGAHPSREVGLHARVIALADERKPFARGAGRYRRRVLGAGSEFVRRR